MPTPWDAVYKQVLQRFFQKQRVTTNTEVSPMASAVGLSRKDIYYGH